MAWCWGAGARGRARRLRCARAAAHALMHVNLLLMLYAGAALATAARLKWDPSTYIPLREALPAEYPLICALVLGFALALAALAHAALAAVAANTASAHRRPILFLYAVLMTALIAVEVGAATWAAVRVLELLSSPEAERLRKDLRELALHLRAALEVLARWFPLPEKVSALVEEALADLPRNGYAAQGAAIALLLLQPAAVALALLAAAPRTRPPAPDVADPAAEDAPPDPRHQRLFKYQSESEKSVEESPLRTAYKKGRLVVL